MLVGVLLSTFKPSDLWVALENDLVKYLRYLVIFLVLAILSLFIPVLYISRILPFEATPISEGWKMGVFILIFVLLSMKGIFLFRKADSITFFQDLIFVLFFSFIYWAETQDVGKSSGLIAIGLFLELFSTTTKRQNEVARRDSKGIKENPDGHFLAVQMIFLVFSYVLLEYSTREIMFFGTTSLILDCLFVFSIFQTLFSIFGIVRGIFLREKFRFGFFDAQNRIFYIIESTANSLYVLKEYSKWENDQEVFVYNSPGEYSRKVIKTEDITRFAVKRNQINPAIFFENFIEYTGPKMSFPDRLRAYQNECLAKMIERRKIRMKRQSEGKYRILETRYEYNLFTVTIGILKRCNSIWINAQIQDETRGISRLLRAEEKNRFLPGSNYEFSFWVYDQDYYHSEIYPIEVDHSDCQIVKMLSEEELESLNKDSE